MEFQPTDAPCEPGEGAAGHADPRLTPRQRRWEVLVQHRALIVSHARRCGARDPEDVAQALIKGFLSTTLDEARSLPFLLAVAANLVHDDRRRAAVCARALSRIVDAQANDPCPSEMAELREFAHWLFRRLVECEPEITVRMVLRRCEGLTWPMLAEEFGVTSAAACGCAARSSGYATGWLANSTKDLAEVLDPHT